MSGTLSTTEYVGSGVGNSGSDSGTTIVEGGAQVVGLDFGTGTATNTAIDGGGVQEVGVDFGIGTALSTTISGSVESDTILESVQYVGYTSGTGTASGTTIYSGGDQFVGAGGVGTAIGTTIFSGGGQGVGVLGGTGTATNTTINAGGQQNVGDGGLGTAIGTTISGGAQYVGFDDGTGTATNTVIDGGAQYIGYEFGTGTATSTTISGGVQEVGALPETNGTATGTSVLNGGEQIVGGDLGTGTATDTIVFKGGWLEIASAGVANTPVIDGGMLELEQGASIKTGPIDFAAVSGTNGGTLDLTGEGSSFTLAAKISGFTGTDDTAATSDIIDVAGSGATDHVVWTQDGASGTLQVENASDDVLEILTLEGAYSQNHFVLTNAKSVDQIAYDTNLPCYCQGTRILTDLGEVAVEALSVGDLAITVSGRARPIVWIGHRRIDISRHPDPAAVRPVRVSAGAFGEGLPRRDLWLSPGHNVMSENALMPISGLINGLSVAQIEQDRVEYWHVELDAHDIILAEALAAESYLDCGNRAAFADGGDFVEAHPDFLPKHWSETCLPLVKEGAAVEMTRQRLVERLEAKGYAIVEADGAHIVADGRAIEPVRLSGTRLAFALPGGAKRITLRSNVFVPAQTSLRNVDDRELGLCVARLQIDGDDIALGREASLNEGWHKGEYDDETFARRWTNGAAELPPGARFVIVDLAGRGYYWRAPETWALAARA